MPLHDEIITCHQEQLAFGNHNGEPDLNANDDHNDSAYPPSNKDSDDNDGNDPDANDDESGWADGDSKYTSSDDDANDYQSDRRR
jgi:hypothetical protein